MLDKQVGIYSCDTGDFYSNTEARLHNLNHKVRYERKVLLSELKVLIGKLNENGFDDEKLELIWKIVKEKDYDISDEIEVSDEIVNCDNDEIKNMIVKYVHLNRYIEHKRKIANGYKEELWELLANKVEANIKTNGTHHVRKLNKEHLSDNRKISVFISSFIRMMGISQNEFTENFLVVQVYYFDIIKDLILHGFEYKGERYIFYTASAGQIRTKKTVFVKESEWYKYEKTIMCGLTLDIINAKGGNNPNKHLAYMALSNSATDLWKDFDIDKTIVVDDFETQVFGTYDLIDDADYSIKRISGYVPITHTDGAGMILNGKNRMVRLPWIKGLLGHFDFVSFINEHNCPTVIKDIYGQEHDIIKEDIQIIFTKSQFKMWKYYDSWEQYKECYKKYNCTAGYANIESDKIKNTTINYQMLQTLVDYTDDELKEIAAKSVDKLMGLCKSIDSMKRAFGITVYNTDKTYLQKCIDIYPDLMTDRYMKRRLKEIKDNLVKRSRAGHLDVNGKYTFILPDFYAACEYWFKGIQSPKGLLEDNEVFCWLFRANDKLDCLRSPHLYMEHAVRKNKAYYENERQANLRKWFDTNALYTSCHDLISKVLQFDVDGDMSLVVSDKVLIDVAERNIKKYDIKPLYYNMKKAEPRILTKAAIYEGLKSAFTGSNIGMYSNAISKIWNSDVFVSGSYDEQVQAINIIKYLCCENNFCIDRAKTLYMPIRPKKIHKLITAHTKSKLPHFFVYAKDKTEEQVEKTNSSLVNKLYDVIPNPRISYKKLGLGEVDYKLLMSDTNVDVKVAFKKNRQIDERKTEKLIVTYLELSKKYSYKINARLSDSSVKLPLDIINSSQLREQALIHQWMIKVIDELKELDIDVEIMVNKLVRFLYGMNKSMNVELLWLCYGEQLYSNLKKNLYLLPNKTRNEKKKEKQIECIDCGKWMAVNYMSKTIRCRNCQHEYDKKVNRGWMRRSRMKLRNSTK